MRTLQPSLSRPGVIRVQQFFESVSWPIRLPSRGITVEESHRGGEMVNFAVHHLSLPDGEPALNNRVAPTTGTPILRRAAASGEKGTRAA